ncbi:MAG: bifunctional heptose 7-phosphate kinase/heptose 1-phosphate adenyltransferase [Planctomycetota bacterium]|jgi:rfaE bifunctional protein kinase chain/domain
MTQPEITTSRLDEIVAKFPKLRVGVVGDFIADVYIYGTPSRLSREAPVIVLQWDGEQTGPGGAANSAANLRALGSRVSCVGVVGQDMSGHRLREGFLAESVDVSGLLMGPGVRTITKTRILAGDLHRSKQQVIRVDREPDGSLSDDSMAHTLDAVRRLSPEIDAWLVSDYGYGTVNEEIYDALREDEGGAERVVVVDSRRRILQFQGATAVTPNEEEASTAAALPVGTEDEARAAGARVRKLTSAKHVLLTRGNEGLAVFSEGDDHLVPASKDGPEEITDNNGAGDTVAATFTLALAAGASPLEAACLANHAGGIVVMKPGAATLTVDELSARFKSHGGA